MISEKGFALFLLREVIVIWQVKEVGTLIGGIALLAQGEAAGIASINCDLYVREQKKRRRDLTLIKE